MADDLNTSGIVAGHPVDGSLITYTNVIYALHSLSVLIGLSSGVTIIGSFIFGLPSIVAVIMNYIRQADARGTFIESHFRWQIRTFWFTLLWAIIILVVSAPLVLLLGLGVVTFFAGFVVLAIWMIYRIVRGWSALRGNRPIHP